MVNTDLLENQSFRDQVIGKIEVLDKVKKLFLIPEIDMMTVKQVAEYFEVDNETIKKCYQRNKDEINLDGVKLKKLDFWKGHFVPAKNSQRGSTLFKINDELSILIPNAGALCFSKRAILRIAMLLRDSVVAQEVRTQLLNVFEHSSTEQKTFEIDQETQLLMNLAKSIVTGTKEECFGACKDYIDYQNRHITKLKTQNTELSQNNKALANEVLEWQDRACVNKAVRLLANNLHLTYGTMWNTLYDELLYKHGIGLKMRGTSPFIQHVKEDEWKYVVQTLSAICESNDLSASKIFQSAKL